MVEAVIFDMDGVIIDSEPLHKEVLKEYMKELKIQVSEELYNTFIGSTSIEMFTQLKEKFNFQGEVEEVIETYAERYVEYIKKHEDIKPIAGIKELIEELHERGIKIALASSSCRMHIDMVLNMFSFNKYFDVVVSGHDVEKPKPNPDIFLRTSELLEVKPEQCLVIEDSFNGVRAAKSAGMICIAYDNQNSGAQNREDADAIVKSISDINMAYIEKVIK